MKEQITYTQYEEVFGHCDSQYSTILVLCQAENSQCQQNLPFIVNTTIT